mmetsp:Transcript_75020/g.179059  ORF Transcript_75020/g.179059 Transcript_75020/m.179059 type:complete len:390 (-) Transcript_75020:639-1808(-)
MERCEALAGADDARCYELGHRFLELGVRHHLLLRFLRVVLHFLQEHIDLRVMQDLLDFWICHGMADLLFVHLCTSRGLANLRQDLVSALLALRVFRVQLQSLLVSLQRLVVFLHKEVRCSFPGIRFHEAGVQLEALIQVSKSIRIRQEFGQCGCPVGVHLCILGIAFEALVVLRLGLCIFLLLEELVALFSVLLGLCRVEVGLFLMLLLCPLALPQGVASAPIVVLGQRLVVHGNRIIILVLLLVNRSHPLENLGDLLEGCATRVRTVDLISSINEILAAFEDLVKVLCSHLNEDGIPVVVVCDVVGYDGDRLVVHLQGFLELLLFVQLVAFGLPVVRLFLLGRPEVLGRSLFLLRLLLLLGSWRRLRFVEILTAHGADIDALHGHEEF